MEIFGLLAVMVVAVAAGAYFLGKMRVKRDIEKESKKVLKNAVEAMKKNDINLKKLSDSDLDKFI